MVSTSERDPRVLWAFWVACGLAATGAVAPLLLAAGDAGEIAGVAIPFGIASLAMAANAMTYPRGKSVATALYVLAWVAVVYGILRMIAVPLQMLGFALPFTGSESAAIAVGLITGALSLQVGLYGLRALYKGPGKQQAARVEPVDPPPAMVAAVPAAAPSRPANVEEPGAAGQAATQPPAADTAAAAPAPQPARKPRTRRPKPPAELPPPSEQAELPAHPEPVELPPHSSTTSSS